MPSATARRMYEDQIPSFMTVFDLASEAMDEQGVVTVVDPKIIGLNGQDGKLPSHASHPTQQASSLPQPAVVGAAPHSLPLDPATHRHHDSTSTQTSESADSSPTTTMSCTDSSSLSDPSPSSSPDSPVNLVPLAAFPGPSFAGGPSLSSGLSSLSIKDANQVQDRPMTSPSPRRARNMKGLSIQPPFMSPTFSMLSNSSMASEPASPSFIKPQIPAMKRKPSQLSLKTSTHDLIKSTTLEVPPSPALALPPILQRRALKHSTSSPHMLSSLRSATFGPSGGMAIPTVLERNENGLSEFLRPSRPSRPTGSAGFDSTILEEESPIRTQIANRAAYEFEPYHEHENNEDLKTPGYPDGPIAIYDDNVFLYLEPTAEEASRFDVVINVAREVDNPFKTLSVPSQKENVTNTTNVTSATSATSATLEDVTEETETPDQEMQNATIFPPSLLPPLALATTIPMQESTPPEDNTPTTPKASVPLKEPEYIHIPWDHNTDIGEDLMMLCETIEKKTKEGKKVLIHCQQGASRSASLIIAYGLYQNPILTVNDAYYAAQAKSQWISPNMRLMYCLQDFQKEVAKKKLPAGSTYRPRSGRRSPAKHHRTTLSADAIDIPPKEPLSAPLPPEDSKDGSRGGGNDDSDLCGPGSGSLSRSLSPAGRSSSSRGRQRRNSSPTSSDLLSPGPSSAPSMFSWSEKDDEKDLPKPKPEALPEAPKLLQPPPVLKTTRSASGSGMRPTETTFLRPAPLLAPPGFKEGNSCVTGPPPPSPGFGPPSLGFRQGKGSMMKPPPSPGFAAHRFGEFPRLGLGNTNSTTTTGPGLTLSSFALFSPGLPHTGRGDSDGVDSLGAKICDTAMDEPPPAPIESAPAQLLPPAPLLPRAPTPPTHPVEPSAPHPFAIEEPLMSPRAETMTTNPLHKPQVSAFPGLTFVEEPPTPSCEANPMAGLFSPREASFPRDLFSSFGRPKKQAEDPRSPPTKGEAPIMRSIDDLI